jgi:hypothetical protein
VASVPIIWCVLHMSCDCPLRFNELPLNFAKSPNEDIGCRFRLWNYKENNLKHKVIGYNLSVSCLLEITI